ncbi:MAG: FG-GAP repeat domain-containing protein [Candidatus Competibacterales bacterium]
MTTKYIARAAPLTRVLLLFSAFLDREPTAEELLAPPQNLPSSLLNSPEYPGPTVSVPDANLVGTLRDPQGQPIANAAIDIEGGLGVRSNRDGSWLANVSSAALQNDGKVTVATEPTGFAPLVRDIPLEPQANPTSAVVALVAQLVTLSQTVANPAQQPVTLATAELLVEFMAATVLDANDQPVTEPVTVEATSLGASDSTSDTLRSLIGVTTPAFEPDQPHQPIPVDLFGELVLQTTGASGTPYTETAADILVESIVALGGQPRAAPAPRRVDLSLGQRVEVLKYNPRASAWTVVGQGQVVERNNALAVRALVDEATARYGFGRVVNDVNASTWPGSCLAFEPRRADDGALLIDGFYNARLGFQVEAAPGNPPLPVAVGAPKLLANPLAGGQVGFDLPHAPGEAVVVQLLVRDDAVVGGLGRGYLAEVGGAAPGERRFALVETIAQATPLILAERRGSWSPDKRFEGSPVYGAIFENCLDLGRFAIEIPTSVDEPRLAFNSPANQLVAGSQTLIHANLLDEGQRFDANSALWTDSCGAMAVPGEVTPLDAQQTLLSYGFAAPAGIDRCTLALQVTSRDGSQTLERQHTIAILDGESPPDEPGLVSTDAPQQLTVGTSQVISLTVLDDQQLLDLNSAQVVDGCRGATLTLGEPDFERLNPTLLSYRLQGPPSPGVCELRVQVTGFDGGVRETVLTIEVVLPGPPPGSVNSATPLFPGFKLAMGDSPQSVVATDLNGDGIPDLVTANGISRDVSVRLGQGNGNFAPQTPFDGGSDPVAVIAADLNGDGILDLVTANQTINSNISVLLGRGDGNFDPQVFLDGGSTPQAIAAADLNGDGIPDLVTANTGESDVSVLLGQGNGSFGLQVPFAVGDNPIAISAADLNGDGALDLVTANGNSNDVSVLLGRGDGNFDPQLPLAVGDNPSAVSTADLNGDGIPDLVTANFGSDDVSVALGQGNGNFDPPLSFPVVGRNPQAIATADLNGDGIPDLVTANFGSDDVNVLLGRGSGNFDPPLRLAISDGPISVATADLDGDGILDLVTANGNSDDVSVRLGQGNGNFDQPFPFAMGNGPTAVSTADLNGDGIADLTTANENTANLSVRLGRGNGDFDQQRLLAVGANPQSVTAADLNGDGALDLVTANTGSNDVSVHLGQGNGNFDQPQLRLAMGNGPSSVIAADLNGDGRLDLIAANRGSNDVSVALGQGNGNFDPQRRLAMGSGPSSVTTADLNGDGIPDLVTANETSNDVSVRLGQGNGNFDPPRPFAIGDNPRSVTSADLNGDGILDLVTANIFSAGVGVVLGQGDGDFDPPLPFEVGGFPQSVAAADLNGDGILDLVTANGSSDAVSVLLGQGDGRFDPPLHFEVGNNPRSVAAADLNGDGKLDLISANRFSNDATVLLNRAP